MTVTLKGGQGGLGGRDSQGWPIPGGYQGVVTGTIGVTPGDEITVAVGGAGGEGASSLGSASGGVAGDNPLEGYDGASGGVAGPEGSSGGGGGSGAASVLIVNGTEIVAGGAGGNGGNGQYEPIVGRRAEDSHVPRSDATSTTGRPGLDTWLVCSPGFRCDGGASGAGGGGAEGGEQGAVQYGGANATEYFGFGGYPGANSTADLPGLTASYDFYDGNSQNGSITVAYDNGAPGAPRNLSGTPATGAVALGWSAPIATGSSAISDYIVEYATSADGPFTTFDDGVSAATGTIVTELVDGVGYFFRVAAVNDEGAGAFTATHIAVVPSDIPEPPVVTDLVAFGGGIQVNFVAGASDSPITGYEYRVDSGDWNVGSVVGSQLTIVGLTNGHSYAVEIRARNIIGASAPSMPPVAATPIDVPAAPTGLLAVAGPGSVDLTWIAPTVDNGSEVLSYIVEIATDPEGPYELVAGSETTSTSATVSGLDNGTTYYLRVAAANAVGIGPSSTPTVATPFTIADAPTIGVTPGDGSVVVDITPGFDGGTDVTSYEYRLGLGGFWKSTGSLLTNFMIGGLVNGTTYDVYVRAINAAGASAASSVASATPRTVPAAPAISTVALDTGAVSVSFSVGSTGGTPITNVEYSIDNGATWTPRSPESADSPVTIDGLVGGITYPVRLRVVNDAGHSDASNTSLVTAKGTPSAPSIVVTEADRALHVVVTAPANGGTPIVDYQFSINDGISWLSRVPASTGSPLVISGLDNGSAYPVRVRAVNGVGAGPSSNLVIATPHTTPGAPTISAQGVVDVNGALDVEFNPPASNGGSAITTYEYSTDAGLTWIARQSGTTSSPLHIAVLSSDGQSSLTGGVTYSVEIRALNAAGAGLASDVAVGIPTTTPNAPVIVSADGGDGSASIAFIPPSNGGSAIVRYEYRLDLGTWTDTGSLAGQFFISDLLNSTTYSIELRAVNGRGDGPPSAAVPVVVATTPSAPSLAGAVPGDSSVAIAFVAPVSDGGSAITTYEYSTDDGQTWRSRATGTTGSPLVVTTQSDAGGAPLVNATIYSMQVRAVNLRGAGAASETIYAAPHGLPTAPVALGVVAGDGTLTLTFHPGSDGGSPITDLEYTLGNDDWVTAGSLSSPLTVTGLDNGVSYTLAVRARNTVGAGPESATLSGTPRTVPGAPVVGIVVAGSHQVTATWLPPVFDGGAAVSGYTVSVYSESSGGTPIASCTTQDLSCTVLGLTDGTTVYVDVTATNEAGSGAPSAPRVARVPVSAPHVEISSITPSATSLSLAVDVVDGGGAPLTNLEYQLGTGEWQDAGTSTGPINIVGLTKGVEYSVRIRATNAAGTGEPSASLFAVPHTTPSLPTALSATAEDSSVTLSWAAPADDGGQPIDDYTVEYGTDPLGPFSSFIDGISSVTTATVTGLDNGTTYFFHVGAVNTAGTGSWSGLASATPLAAPSAPTIWAVTSGSRFLRVWFASPSSEGGSPATSYEYRLDNGVWHTASTTTSPLTIPGLSNGQTYDVEIRAVNIVGPGDTSNLMAAKPYGLPGAVRGLRASPSADAVTLDWDAANDNGSPINHYNVMLWTGPTEGAIIVSYPTTDTTFTFDGFPDGIYYFSVEAVNAAGPGARASTRTTAIVGGIVPSAPVALSTSVENDNVAMEWSAGDEGTSPITDYLVQYSTDDTTWVTMSSGSDSTFATFDVSTSSPYSLRVAAVSAVGVGPFAVVRPPLVHTGAVTGEMADTAHVVGTANANGNTADVSFEYATSADDLGTPAAATTAGTPATVDGSTETAVSADLTSLLANTSYVVRTMVTADGVVVFGETRSFTTSAAIAVPITVEGLHDVQLDSGPVILPATTPGNLPLTYTAGPPSVCSIVGTSVVLVGVGTCTVVANQAGDAGHLPATATGSFVVSAVPVTPVTPVTPALSLALQLSPGQPVADATILVHAEGLEPSSQVRIDLQPSGVHLGIRTTDVNGSLDAAVAMPHALSVGTHDIVATGSRPNGQSLVATKQVFVDWAGALGATLVAGGYTPLTATRILDTRDTGARMPATTEYHLALPISLVPDDVSALVLNLTVTDAERDGYITIYPCGSDRPLAAAINFTAGETKANLVDAMFHRGDALCLWSNVDTHAVVDLQGFHSDAGQGHIVPRTAVRLVDTRPNDPLTAGQVLQIPVIGDGRAAAQTTTVALNVAVDDPQGAGFMTVYPCGTDRPWASNLNFKRGQTVSNEVMVQPGTNGMVCVYTTATTQLVVDLDATYQPTPGARFTALVPGRLADTRLTTNLVAGRPVEWTVVGANGAPAGTIAMSFNVAVTNPARAGFVTVYPCGSPMPLASNLNFAAGQTISNHVTAAVGSDGKICVFSSQNTDIVIDVEGIYGVG